MEWAIRWLFGPSVDELQVRKSAVIDRTAQRAERQLQKVRDTIAERSLKAAKLYQSIKLHEGQGRPVPHLVQQYLALVRALLEMQKHLNTSESLLTASQMGRQDAMNKVELGRDIERLTQFTATLLKPLGAQIRRQEQATERGAQNLTEVLGDVYDVNNEDAELHELASPSNLMGMQDRELGSFFSQLSENDKGILNQLGVAPPGVAYDPRSVDNSDDDAETNELVEALIREATEEDAARTRARRQKHQPRASDEAFVEQLPPAPTRPVRVLQMPVSDSTEPRRVVPVSSSSSSSSSSPPPPPPPPPPIAVSSDDQPDTDIIALQARFALLGD
jgi:hypothetical protein